MPNDPFTLFAQNPGAETAYAIGVMFGYISLWCLGILIQGCILRSAARTVCDIKMLLPVATGYSFIVWIVSSAVNWCIRTEGIRLLWFNWPKPEVVPIVATFICCLFAWIVISTVTYGLMIHDRRRQPIRLYKGFLIALMTLWIWFVIVVVLGIIGFLIALVVHVVEWAT